MLNATLPKGSKPMIKSNDKEVRRVRVSRQRQINIPKDFYEALNLSDEALVEFTGKEIIIRPMDYEVIDFSTDILEDLVEQGYSGKELIQKFKQIKSEIPKALDRMKEEAMKNKLIKDDLDDYLDSMEDHQNI